MGKISLLLSIGKVFYCNSGKHYKRNYFMLKADSCQFYQTNELSHIFPLFRQNIAVVSGDDIIITSIENINDGLRVTFFVRGMNGEVSGVISAEVVEEALQVSINNNVNYSIKI